MNIENIILRKLNRNKSVKVSDVVKETGFSRAYINRFFLNLKKAGKIILIGKANRVLYVLPGNLKKSLTRDSILVIKRLFKNKSVSEDLVFNEIKENTDILLKLPKNILDILQYAFTEMLNNAIDHSRSEKIQIIMKRDDKSIKFEIRDWGVGIFNNIMKKRKLKNKLEAIQDLLKGKQTTAPKKHSGEGIFFTSKIAEKLIIQSSDKKLIFDNVIDDIFIKNIINTKGTKVEFKIILSSKRNLNSTFRKYSGKAFDFSKTETRISLYKLNSEFISRSQARRIVSGLDKFKKVVLDFRGVETVGQGFADEIFRVWQNNNHNIKIDYLNANENIIFMIKRTIAKSL